MRKTTDTTELVRLLSRVSLITQVGLSVVTPPILCILGALWLQEHAGVGDWILLCAILIGILSGVTSVFSFVRREAMRDVKKQRKETEPVETEKEKER